MKASRDASFRVKGLFESPVLQAMPKLGQISKL